MAKKRWLLLTALAVTTILAACRPATGDGFGGTRADPQPVPSATATVGQEPTVQIQDATDTPETEASDVDDLLAQVPTPPPGAVVPTPASLQPESVAVKGAADAPITIVEFSDFQCPYCLSYVNDAYPQIIQNYVETGQVRYVFKDFPLLQLHPQAVKAAEAARCAGDQDKYWEMHDRLFDMQDRWAGLADPVPVLVELGQGLGLDPAGLQSCLQSGRYQAQVLENLAEGQALGVTGTPTFFINGFPLVGARPYELFQLALALASAGRLSDAYAQAPTPTPMPPDQIPTGNAPELGSPDAPVLMIEYSDYQCPFCSRYVNETFPRIRAEYIDTGKVRYVFKDFPLDFHAQAELAAQAARCAGDQGDYWGMHDLLFAGQGEWGSAAASEIMLGYADALGLDSAAFESCLGDGRHADAVLADLQEGFSVGVTGTPAFFVGSRFISGAQPYDVFQRTIEAALAEQ